MLEHSSPSIVQNYAKAVDEHKRDAIRRLESLRPERRPITCPFHPQHAQTEMISTKMVVLRGEPVYRTNSSVPSAVEIERAERLRWPKELAYNIVNMSGSEIYEAVKRATVGIVAEFPNAFPKRPFTIIGTGFCIDPAGIIITCRHVFEAFWPTGPNAAPGTSQKVVAPYAMFYGGAQGKELRMFPVGIHNAVTVNKFDLCAGKVSRHPAYPDGYPALAIADYVELHEMMEIATCGYPLGEVMNDQLGTVTSSFTKGMISSIIPAQGVSLEHLKGFQLDLTATNGNSGGPVFSMSTGKVFGVLQGGVVHPTTGHAVQGITKAEPIYPLLADDLLDRLKQMPPMHS